ncbi:hypothetical protein JHW43_009551 [Diplocarpon mali]|nr:hypothetical protein JHW43_009551 [Diplocarpon mali]
MENDTTPAAPSARVPPPRPADALVPGCHVRRSIDPVGNERGPATLVSGALAVLSPLSRPNLTLALKMPRRPRSRRHAATSVNIRAAAARRSAQRDRTPGGNPPPSRRLGLRSRESVSVKCRRAHAAEIGRGARTPSVRKQLSPAKSRGSARVALYPLWVRDGPLDSLVAHPRRLEREREREREARWLRPGGGIPAVLLPAGPGGQLVAARQVAARHVNTQTRGGGCVSPRGAGIPIPIPTAASLPLRFSRALSRRSARHTPAGDQAGSRPGARNPASVGLPRPTPTGRPGTETDADAGEQRLRTYCLPASSALRTQSRGREAVGVSGCRDVEEERIAEAG